MEVANRLVNTENEGDPSQADVASNNDDDGSHDIEESFLFNPAILDALTKPNMPPASSARQLDTIYLRNQKISAVIGPDAWNRAGKPQPIVLSLQLQIDTTSASTTDDLKNTFSYGQMCKDITAKLDGKTFTSMEHLTSDLAGLADHWPGETLQLQALAPKGMLRVEGGFGRDFCLRRVETQTQGRKTLNWHVASHEWVVKGLKLGCIIGVNPHERLEKQNISIDLRILGEPEVADYTLQTKGGFDTWRQLVKKISEVCFCPILCLVL